MSNPAATAQPATVPAALPALETVTGADLLSDLPEVNERAVAAVAGSPAAAPAPAATAPGKSYPPDKLGRAFDATRFRTNKDGSPFLNGKGQFMPRGGRKPLKSGASTAPKETGSSIPADLPGLGSEPLSSPSPAVSPASVTTDAAVSVVSIEEHEASAEGLLRGAYSLTDALMRGKGEWQPEDESEHRGVKAAYVAWARAGGQRPMSPGWGFLMAVLGFVSKRLEKPNTQSRLLKWFPWLAAEDEPPADPKKPAPPAAPAVPQRPLSTDIA